MSVSASEPEPEMKKAEAEAKEMTSSVDYGRRFLFEMSKLPWTQIVLRYGKKWRTVSRMDNKAIGPKTLATMMQLVTGQYNTYMTADAIRMGKRLVVIVDDLSKMVQGGGDAKATITAQLELMSVGSVIMFDTARFIVV